MNKYHNISIKVLLLFFLNCFCLGGFASTVVNNQTVTKGGHSISVTYCSNGDGTYKMQLDGGDSQINGYNNPNFAVNNITGTLYDWSYDDNYFRFSFSGNPAPGNVVTAYVVLQFKVGNTTETVEFTASDLPIGDIDWTNSCSGSPTPSTRTPSIYIGKQPTVSGNTATINLQLSDWGCVGVDKVKIYYTTNNTEPTTSSSYWEETFASAKTSNANFDVVKSSLSTGTYKIKVAAHNSVGWGELSDLATFKISCSPPSFSSQPASETTQTQCKGVAFSAIEVSVSGTAESYQWQASDAADGDYANVTDGTGGTMASFIPSSSTLGTRYYKCVVTGCGTTITTDNPVACTVDGITVTTVPATTNIHAYEPVTLTSSANVTWDIATVPGGVTKGTEAFLVDGSYGTAGSFVGLNTVVFKGKAGDGYKIRATALNNCYEDIDFNVSSDSETCP